MKRYAIVMVAILLITIACATGSKLISLDADNALMFQHAWRNLEGVEGKHTLMHHECCACGLTHWVLIIVGPEGVTTYWWVDKKGTNRSRFFKKQLEGAKNWEIEN